MRDASRSKRVRLADVLKDLPRREAEVLWLYHGDGLSFEAIGDRLGLDRNTVRSTWLRGLRGLKHKITL